jgi:crotonobetainyl-CoA:carnitine CoA-transferase CaiB-like acyl-CoA transferase
VNAAVGEWVRARSCDEVLAALGPRGARLPCARVAAPEELLSDAQLAARGMLERHPHPALGEIVLHGNPLRFAGAEPRARALAPALGADNASVYGELGLGAAELARLARDGVV